MIMLPRCISLAVVCAFQSLLGSFGHFLKDPVKRRRIIMSSFLLHSVTDGSLTKFLKIGTTTS